MEVGKRKWTILRKRKTPYSPGHNRASQLSCSAFQKTWADRSWEEASQLCLVPCIPSYSLCPWLSWGTIVSYKRWSVSRNIKSFSDYASSNWNWTCSMLQIKNILFWSSGQKRSWYEIQNSVWDVNSKRILKLWKSREYRVRDIARFAYEGCKT